jgi:hypothetical protein
MFMKTEMLTSFCNQSRSLLTEAIAVLDGDDERVDVVEVVAVWISAATIKHAQPVVVPAKVEVRRCRVEVVPQRLLGR